MQQKDKKTKSKTVEGFLKRNVFNIIFWGAIILVLVSSDAKTWVLRQMTYTGIFNAKLDKTTPPENSVRYDFDFSEENGPVINTSTLRGQVVFINFWASWCPPCRAEFPSIEKLYQKFSDHPDMFFLMINEDQAIEKGESYLEKENFTVPLHRLKSTIPKDIYSGALPTTIVLDKKGNIRMHHTGFSNYNSKKFIAQIEALLAE